MAVIGRLDEQVDALLITPLDKNRTPAPAAQDEQAANEKPKRAPQAMQTHEEKNNTASAQEKAVSSGEDDAGSGEEAASSHNERHTRAQLPVWLL